VRVFVLIFTLSLATAAHADRLTDILLDHQKSEAFCRTLKKSMVIIAVSPFSEDWVGPQITVERLGTAVAVADKSGKIRLLTSGPLVQGHGKIRVRLPSGRVVIANRVIVLGDGALAEITVTGQDELVPMALADPKIVDRGLPVFSVGNLGSDMPVLVKAVVVERLREPVKGLIINDLKAVLGWPLVTADGTLAGINFRPHPTESGLAVGVGSEMIGAWLHPKGPKADPQPAVN
jgi:hypothetical protein